MRRLHKPVHNLGLYFLLLCSYSSLLGFFGIAGAKIEISRRQEGPSDRTAGSICAGPTCLVGSTGLTAGVRFLDSETSSNASSSNSTPNSVILLPGQYDLNSLAPEFNSFASAQVTQGQGFNTTSPPRITVSRIPGDAILYQLPLFQGSSQPIPPQSPSSANKSLDSMKASSLLVDDGTFAVVNDEKDNRYVLWTGLSDTSSLSSSQLTLNHLEGAGCPQGCSSGGVCNIEGICECKQGFTGDRCQDCVTGSFGPDCQPCQCADDETCDEGVTGTGICSPPPANATSPCACINGICSNDNSSCSCNAGWANAQNGTLCSVCAQGFALSDDGDCLACFPGCTSCSSTRCNTCENGLQVSGSDARVCEVGGFIPSGSNDTSFADCPDGQFSSNGVCTDCDGVCESCFGPGPDNCLRCASPRSLLAGTCVDVDASTGICDKNASTGLTDAQKVDNANYVVDNSKSECDALPHKCTFGRIPNFSSNAERNSLVCEQCSDGAFLLDGDCVTPCPGGTFADDGKCSNCDSSCATCGPSAGDFCLTCSSASSVILEGRCVDSCPKGTFNNNGTCSNCHPDCSTCWNSATECLTCSSKRPILSSSTCLLTCARNEYYDNEDEQCKSCSGDCDTCSGSGQDECLSCSDGKSWDNGSCKPTTCEGGVIEGFGVCLSSLLTVARKEDQNEKEESSKNLALPTFAIVLLAILPLLLILLLIWLLRKWNQKKRRKQTKKFGEKRSITGMFHWWYVRRKERKEQKKHEKFMQEQYKRNQQQQFLNEYPNGNATTGIISNNNASAPAPALVRSASSNSGNTRQIDIEPEKDHNFSSNNSNNYLRSHSCQQATSESSRFGNNHDTRTLCSVNATSNTQPSRGSTRRQPSTSSNSNHVIFLDQTSSSTPSTSSSNLYHNEHSSNSFYNGGVGNVESGGGGGGGVGGDRKVVLIQRPSTPQSPPLYQDHHLNAPVSSTSTLFDESNRPNTLLLPTNCSKPLVED